MSNSDFTYTFWCWRNKLAAIMTMLSALAHYSLADEEIEVIKSELHNTNDEKNLWFDYTINGKAHRLIFSVSADADNSDILFIRIKAPERLKDKIEALDTFQSLFDELR